jgi:hypothetical protein
VIERRAPTYLQDLARDVRALHIQVTQGQCGDRRQCLGRVRHLLHALERVRLLDQLAQVILAHRRTRLVQSYTLGTPEARAWVGDEEHGGTVRVIDQVRANETLKVALSSLQAIRYRPQGRFKGQQGQRIAVVDPGGRRAEPEQGQSAREVPIVGLAQLEPDRIQRGGDNVRVDALACQATKRLLDQRFDLIRARGVNPC